MAAKKERAKTGGGPKTTQDLDDFEAQIVGIIGEAAISGVEGGLDLNQVLLDQSASGTGTTGNIKL